MEVALSAGDAFVPLVRLALDAEFPFMVVYNLDSVGLVRRDTACGLSSFSGIWLCSLMVLQVFLLLNLNGVPPALQYVDKADSGALFRLDLTDAWNGVRFITLSFIFVVG